MHAVVMERLKFVPIGWTKRYEFSEQDIQVSIWFILDYYEGNKDLNNYQSFLDKYMRVLGHSIYGGKIDNGFDILSMQSLI